jgi:hypothetical protein
MDPFTYSFGSPYTESFHALNEVGILFETYTMVLAKFGPLVANKFPFEKPC